MGAFPGKNLACFRTGSNCPQQRQREARLRPRLLARLIGVDGAVAGHINALGVRVCRVRSQVKISLSSAGLIHLLHVRGRIRWTQVF